MPTPGELMKKLSHTRDTLPASTSPKSSATNANVETPGVQNAADQPEIGQTGLGQPEQVKFKPTHPELEIIQLTSLNSIVDLAETNDEMLLAARIRNHVKLVSIKPGNLQINLVGAAPDQLAGDIARYLSQWTGQRWLVSVSETGGGKTLVEKQRDADEKLRVAVANEPLVARIMDIFPGANIDEIKTPETAITSPTVDSDDTLLPKIDEEEMSG